jgi:putative membrane protein
MKLLRSLFTLLVVLAAVVIGIVFAEQNKSPVPLDLLVYTFEPKSLALWILAALALGGLLGMLISSTLMVRLSAGKRAANKQLSKARAELDNLRIAGLKDSE